MPETATRMQVRDAHDPREAIFGGTRYLRVLANMFNGDLELTIAGYNAGEGAVVRYATVRGDAAVRDPGAHVLPALPCGGQSGAGVEHLLTLRGDASRLHDIAGVVPALRRR